jgi:nitrite reductase/ring-hydroxylating ferredoxin subunit
MPPAIVCHIDDIKEGESKGFTVNREALFAVKKNGQLFLYRNACPHLGVRLECLPDAFLDIDGEFIICSNHGALFEIDGGYCIAGPCSKQRLQRLDFELENGFVLIMQDALRAVGRV